MKEKVKTPKSKTVSTLRSLKAGKVGLFAGVLALPIAPATIITLINWEEWFIKTDKTLPFGFASLLLTVIVAVVGILKSDTVFKKVDIALYFLAGVLMCVGITCMFLSSLLTQMGYMWLATGSGLLASGVCSTVEKKVIEPNIEFYEVLVNDNQLDKKAKRRQDRFARAQAEAKREAEELEERRRRATTE